MTSLIDADALSVGPNPADAAYIGDRLEWLGKVSPERISSLAAHFDAERVEGQVLLSDSFDRADGALGSTDGPGDAVAWQVLTGVVNVSGDKMLANGTLVHTVVESGAADCAVEASFGNANMHYVIGRCVDSGNFLILGYEATTVSTTLRFYKYDGGSFSQLAANTAAFDYTSAPEHTIRFVMVGDRLRGYVNNVLYLEHTLSAGDYTKYGSATKHGTRMNAGMKMDNFSVTSLTPSTDLAAAVDTFDRSTAAEIIDLEGTRAGGTGTALRLPGTASNYASTPDSVTNSITGSIDIRWWGWMEDWTQAALAALISKWEQAANQKSWAFDINTDGKVRFYISTDGSNLLYAESSVAPAVNDGDMLGLRVTYDGATRETIFYTASVDLADPFSASWVQLGTVQTHTATPLFDSTAPVTVHGTSAAIAGLFTGGVIGAEVRDGIDGTIVASPDFTAQPAGTTSFDDDQGNTWTINQSHGSIGSTETDEAAASAWSTDGDSGVWRIVNGRAEYVSEGSDYHPTTVDTGIADADVRVTVTNPAVNMMAPIARHVDSSNFLAVYFGAAGQIHLFKRDAGSYILLAAATATYTVDLSVALRMVLVGARIWVYVDDTLACTYSLSGADQTKYGAATRHGIGSPNTGRYLDNFRVSPPPLVPVWPDLSGKHRHAVQTDVTKQPVLLSNIKNSRPVVRFDGVDDYLQTTAFDSALTQPNTVLSTQRSDSTGVVTYVLDALGTSDRHYFGYWVTRHTVFAGARLEGDAVLTVNWEQKGAIVNGVDSVLRLNGSADGSVGDAGAMPLGGITVGARYDGLAYWWSGDIGELVVANADLDATDELIPAENYLIRRWT